MGEDILIFDADSIAYKAAAANEAKSIQVTDKLDGSQKHYDNRTAFRAELKTMEGRTEDHFDILDVQEPRHISYGQSLIREMIKKYKVMTGIQASEIYISGKNNFRDLIPLPKKYKGKRDDTIRPVQLRELRQWMITDLGAIVVDDREVDDMSSIRAYDGVRDKQKIVQVTVDKDALQCVGWLFNPDKDLKPRSIQGLGELHREGKGIKGTGRMWLYFQILYGDSTDCYHGSDLWKMQQPGRKFGEVAAYNILKDADSDKMAWELLYNQYKLWYPTPVSYTAEFDGLEYTKDAVDIMQMYADCAHMQRWKGDRIDCRGTLTKLGLL